MIGEPMDVLLGLVSMDKLHKFASKAGFEHEFLAHFGSNVLLYHDTSCEVVFWSVSKDHKNTLKDVITACESDSSVAQGLWS
ncbi:hypothetical protein AAC387_Pa11g1186 [Persea americana]